MSSLDPSNRGISAGGPFSAVTSSMWPQDILVKLSEQDDNSDPNHQPDYRYHSLKYCNYTIFSVFK